MMGDKDEEKTWENPVTRSGEPAPTGTPRQHSLGVLPKPFKLKLPAENQSPMATWKKSPVYRLNLFLKTPAKKWWLILETS